MKNRWLAIIHCTLVVIIFGSERVSGGPRVELSGLWREEQGLELLIKKQVELQERRLAETEARMAEMRVGFSCVFFTNYLNVLNV